MEAKEVCRVSPQKSFQANKKIKIEYNDGSITEFQTALSHEEFMTTWKGFCDWYRFIVQGHANYIEDWTG